MSYLNTADLAKAASFRARLVSGIVTEAGNVLNESQGTRSNAWEEKRVQLANNVLTDPENKAYAFVWPVLSNVYIAQAGLDAADADIATQIAAMWDTVAGVSTADKTAP